MAAALLRRFLGVTILALWAGTASAGEGGSSFTVSARVIRSAAVRVTARPDAGRVRVEATVARLGAGAAGLALGASRGGWSRVTEGALSASVPDRSGVLVVTVLPDGAPPALRLRD
jgi:hypothetical protein